MFDRYLRFVGTMSATRVGRAGVILTTSSFLTLVVLQLGMLLGLVTNAYAGLLIYLLLPALFVLGLLLIPLGWILLRRRTGKSGVWCWNRLTGREHSTTGRCASGRDASSPGLSPPVLRTLEASHERQRTPLSITADS